MNYKQFAAFDGFENLPVGNLKDEVRKKLSNTFLLIGKTLVYVNEIHDVGFAVSYPKNGEKVCTGISFDNIHDLSPFLPDTGVYEIETGLLFLEKLPKKQWKKSFSWDFYTFYFLDDNGQDMSNLPFSIYKSTNCSNDILISGGSVYYLYKKIGKVVDNLIKCTDDLFKQELIDYSREHPQWTLQK